VQDLTDPSKRVVGTKQVLRHIKEGRVELVYLAADADETIRQTILNACEKCSVDVLDTHSMKELGDACRIKVGAAAAGVLKPEGRQP
jgi:large subunit ribosomal protein L7A